MKRIFLLSTILAWIFVQSTSAQTAQLMIPDNLSYGAGKTLAIPVILENSVDVTALEFHIQVPLELTGDSVIPVRCANHESIVRMTSNYYDGYTYKVMLYSPDNSLIKGTLGEVMTLFMPLPETATNGSVYNFLLSNVVICDRSGKNVVTGSQNGKVTIEVVPRPDLKVSDVKVAQTVCEPGGKLDFAWKVENIGDSLTGAGWSEKIYLEDEDGNVTYMATTAYEGILVSGGSVERSYSLNLSDFPGVSGYLRPQVTVYPAADCGEISVDNKNNTAKQKDFSLYVNKYLHMTAYATPIVENSTGAYSCEVRRTGSLAESQIFIVREDVPEGRSPRLVINNGGKVSFAKGSNRTNFYVETVNDNVVTPNGEVRLILNKDKNNGYNTVVDTLYLEEDDKLTLALATDKEEYAEGDTVLLTVNSGERLYPGELSVYFNIENPGRFKLPARVVLPEGQQTATVKIPVLQDKVPANDISIKITATAEHYGKSETIFILKDDDVPAIDLKLTPTTVSESAGVSAMYATLTRSGVTNNKINVKLTDDRTGDLYYTIKTITMPAGTTTVNFPLGVADNSDKEGDRVVNLKAAVYISDCNCDALGDKQTSVVVPITITDDDGPMLSLTSSKSTILEGDENGCELTITRNTNPTDDLVVELECEGTGLEFPKTVIIPTGQKSTKVRFKAWANAVEEGDRTVGINVKSDGYSTGSCWVLVSDRTLPDLIFESVELPKTDCFAGERQQLTARIKNIGAATMSAGVPITVKANGEVMAQYITQEPIAKDESKEFVIPVHVSKVPGEYAVNVVANEKNNMGELQYVNNSSETINLKVNSLYSFSIQSDSETYNAQDIVTLSGKLTACGETGIENVEVEPYIIFHGLRTALSAVTDKDGNFTCKYALPQGYRGEFLYGVCNPGEGRTDATQEFIVYGFERNSSAYIKHEVFVNEPYSSSILLKNLSRLPLTGLKAEISGATDRYNLELEIPEGIDGNQVDAEIKYTLTPLQVSTGSNWETINVHLTTNEGATLDMMFYNYTRVHAPKLVANTTNINTTVTKGVARTYPIILTNTGQGETGKITVSLPSGFGSFLSLATPTEIPSMKTNDSTTVMLRFNPGADMDLNLIQKGNIAINSEKGNGIPVYFNVKVVSEDKGNLLVKVRDENTIYGNKDGEHPYVADATVELRDYNTGKLISKVTTGTEGYVLMENINEGYYQLYVTAPKHDSYRQNIVISPGETTEHMATISYQAVSVSWDVVETEVEDEYEIVTTLNYETQVPVPVVRMTIPRSLNLDLVEYGKSTLFNVVLRNDGLITAKNVNVTLFEVEGYEVTPLIPLEGFDLAPERSMTIPVRVTRNSQSEEVRKTSKARVDVVCSGNITTNYEWPCGVDAKYAWIADVINFFSDNTNCSQQHGGGGGAHVFVTIGPTGFSGSGPAGGPGGTGGTGSSIGAGGFIIDADLVRDLLCTFIECAPIPDIPIPKKLGGECTRYVVNSVRSGSLGIGGALACLGEFKKLAKKLADPIGCLETIYDNFISDDEADSRLNFVTASKPVMPAHLSAWCTKAKAFLGYYETIEKTLNAKYDAPLMVDTMDIDLMASIDRVDALLYEFYEKGELYDIDFNTIPDDFAAYEQAVSNGTADAWKPAEGKISVANFTSMMPGGVANWYDFRLKRYVERTINAYRIIDGKEPIGTNYISQAFLDTLASQFDRSEQRIVELGFVSIDEMLEAANVDRINHYENESEGTCATVKLEIEQKLVMTRQAFRGTLTVENSMDTDLKDIDLNVIVSNMQGVQTTNHEMQINFESIDGFEGGLEGPWTLAPKTKGVAKILFIPTKYAAPDTLTTYSFGGNLYFREADSEEVQMRELYPVKLQVKPSPELDLTYFMQRDIYGDNPLTKDVVEPIVPAEFTVLINNKGNGDATKVRMFTKQPQIVENEKGLLVDFAIVSSSLNGGDVALALDSNIATDFGDILAGTSAYATWNMTSSLLGHFTDYQVSLNHVTSYGNPDLSLIDQVTIHELIHSVDVIVGDTVEHAWLVNDEADGNDIPDRLYFRDGTIHEVADVSSKANIEALGDSKYCLRVQAPQKGWYYACVADPTQSMAKILGVSENGNSLDTDCMWQTQYIIQDNNDPLRDNRLHVVFYVDAPKIITYDVEFESTPDVRLAVVSINAVPDENDIAEKVIESLEVAFNKPIDETSFTHEDIFVHREGETISTPITITQLTDSLYKLNTSALSENGYYTLQVRAENIMDKDGFNGYDGKMVKWMLFKDGLVHYNVAPWPSEDAGIVVTDSEYTSGNGDYGSSVEMTATPAYGFDFEYWGHPVTETVSARSMMRNGLNGLSEDNIERFSTENPLVLPLNKDINLYAVFRPKKMKVNFIYDSNGGTVSTGSGLYDYGSIVNFEAAAKDGYLFKGFVVNDGKLQSANSGEVKVDRDEVNIEIIFESTAPKNMLLTDAVDYEPIEVPCANVKLQRSFRKGAWNTICLPCDVKNPVDVFGLGTKVARLTGVESDVMQFATQTQMIANIPYLIQVGSIERSTMEVGAVKTAFYEIPQTSLAVPEGDAPADVYDGVEFIGSYKETTLPADHGYYYISGGALWYVDAEAMVPTGRFRGYFHVPDNMSRLMLYVIDGNATGIANVSGTFNADVYNLSGVKVCKQSDILRMAPGIYIMNGKKFIVR